MPISEALVLAEQILAERAELKLTERSDHGVTFVGGEGTVVLEMHRHGPYTTVTAQTDQLRTSKADVAVRHLLNQMPYQAADDPREY